MIARKQRGVHLETLEDINAAITYLDNLIQCLEFQTTRETFIEGKTLLVKTCVDVLLTLIKVIISEQISRDDKLVSLLINLFIKIFKSPYDAQKASILKYFVTRIIDFLDK